MLVSSEFILVEDWCEKLYMVYMSNLVDTYVQGLGVWNRGDFRLSWVEKEFSDGVGFESKSGDSWPMKVIEKINESSLESFEIPVYLISLPKYWEQKFRNLK